MGEKGGIMWEMTTIGEAIRKERLAHQETQQQLAHAINVSRDAVAAWERNRSKPGVEEVKAIARHYAMTVDALVDQEAIHPEPARRVPILGRIPAGAPLLLVEEEAEYILLPARTLPQGDVYVLTVVGDSMCGDKVRICDGDLAVIQRDAEIVNDGIYAVQIDSEEVTLKRINIFNDWITLLPENPAYRPSVHHMDEVRILGKLLYTMQEWR